MLVVGEAVVVAVVLEVVGVVAEVLDAVGVVRLELAVLVVPGTEVEPVGVVVPLTGDEVPDADTVPVPVAVPEVPAEVDEPVPVALVEAGAADELPVGDVPVMPLTL